MGDVLPENTELIGLWLQLVATGVYLTYFSRCLVVIARDFRRKTWAYWLPIACILIFACTISDAVIALVRAWQAYGVQQEGVQPNPSFYYSNPAAKLSIAKNSIVIVLTFISDLIIVFRTYVVWSRRLIVIAFPVCLVCVNLVLGVLSVDALARLQPGAIQILSLVSVRVRYYFVLTFVLNITCATLIWWKIWRIHSRVASTLSGSTLSGSFTEHVLDVLAQSAGIYCAHLLALIVTDAIGSNVFFLLLDPLPPMAAVVFSMMIVRSKESISYSSHLPTTTQPISFVPWRSTTGQQTTGVSVEIDLEQVVHTDAGSLHQLDERIMDNDLEESMKTSRL